MARDPKTVFCFGFLCGLVGFLVGFSFVQPTVTTTERDQIAAEVYIAFAHRGMYSEDYARWARLSYDAADALMAARGGP